MKQLLLAAGLVLVVPSVAAIYGGEPAPEGEYPWMAHLYAGDVSDPNNIICGGTLIAPTLVLTAGHCVPTLIDHTLGGPTPVSGHPWIDDYRVLLGRAGLAGEGGEIHRVARFHTEHKWGVSSVPTGAVTEAADVAILELAEPSAYLPVQLANRTDEPLYPPGATARVLGWGVTPDGTFPTQLMQVDVPVWSDEACASLPERPEYRVMLDPEHEICAGATGMDSCGGDSGGPLFVRDARGQPLEIGIVSYGAFTDCGDAVYPGVYQEVAAHRAFIDPFLMGVGLGENGCWTQVVGC